MIKRSMRLCVSTFVIAMLCSMLVVSASAAEKTKVTIWTAFPELHEFVVATGEKYMQEHPDIEIEATLYPQRAQEEKVAVALPTGQAADLIELDKFELYPYYLDGYLEPLPENVVQWLEENFPADSVEAVKADDGEVFTFPWIASIKAMLYNKDYFAEAGITEMPETVDEMLAMAQKLVKRDENGNVTRAGLDFRLSGGGAGTSQKFWCQAMIPYGAKMIEKVGDKWRAGYDNEAGLQAIQMYLNAVYRDNIESFDIKSDAEAFGLGLSAMFQRESWVVGYMANNAPDVNYGVFLMPKGPADWGTVGNVMGLAVPKSSKHKQEAFDFAMYLMNDENSVKTFGETGWQPFRANVDYSALYEKSPALKDFTATLSTEGHRIYAYENMIAISEVHNRFAERLMRSFKMKELYDDPEKLKQFIHDMAKETNDILAEYDLLAD